MLESTHAPYSARLKRVFRRAKKRLSRALLLALAALSALSSPAQTSPPQTAPPPAPEHKISPEQADELFRSVDEILKFASTETALPEREKVKRKLVSRDEVVAYLQKHMDEDEDSQRFRRSEVVLKKFGLIPRDFDLRPFLIGLLREQIAGYYDPATKTVNMLDWLDAEQQKPVLAHELTHALQDQSFDLQKWMKGTEKDLITVESPTSDDFDRDEAAEARQAMVEGQATVTLIDYELEPAGMSMAGSPQIVEAMRETMLAGTPDSVQYQKAPLFLKEALTFPYRYGLGFTGDVIAKRGKAGLNDLFKNPPTTTRQIMEPDTFLSGEKLPAMPVPDFKRLFKDYDTVDVGGFGEFDTAMLVGQLATPVIAPKIYPHWRGGYYYAVIVLEPYKEYTQALPPPCSTSSNMFGTNYGYPQADGVVALTVTPSKSVTRHWCRGGSYEGAIYAVPHAPPCESTYPCRSEPYETPNPCPGGQPGPPRCVFHGVVAKPRQYAYPDRLPTPKANGASIVRRFTVKFP